MTPFELVKRGLKIFPAGANKAPLITGWQLKATRDVETITAWIDQGVKAWGIPCGADNGVFVIDLDIDKETGEATGEASLREMPRYRDLIGHANVRTPSGGRHIYLSHFEGARNTTSKLGPKVDTRGEGGYVLAPGSVAQGLEYTGHIPDSFPPVPLGLRAKLLHAPPTAKPPLERLTPTGEVQELLGHIPPDAGYTDWLSVLMALHARYSGSEEGLALAEQWSAGGAKYRPGEVARKWQSFKASGVSWATIPALDRQNGADLSEIARRWAA